MTDTAEYGPDPNEIRKHQKKLLSAREYNLKYRRRDFFKPSAKQRDFANADPRLTEIRLIAASQSGKSSISMAVEAQDATGNYEEWIGPTNRKFLKPPKIHRPHEYMSWIVSTSSQVQKQTMQLNLVGNVDDPNGLGTGFLALDEIVGKPIMQAGRQGVVDNITVRRATGGTGNIGFRTMEQDISAFAGATLDQFRWDEPGPIRTYLECLARLTAVPNSRACVTLTPTEGRDQLYMRYEEPAPLRKTWRMTLFDAEHLTKQQVEEIIARTPEQDRPMRIFGEPAQGSGSVYPYQEQSIIHNVDPAVFESQPWIKVGWGVDITHGGSASAFGAVLAFYDMHSDVLYIVDCIKLKGVNIPTQVQAIRQHPYGDAIVVYPRDSEQPGDAMTGDTLRDQYKRAGLVMASKYVTDDRNKSPGLEDGITHVSTRLATGKLKVAAHCRDWFEEYRSYHRKDRKVVREFCDLMDSTRVLVMGIKQLRYIEMRGFASQYRQPQQKRDWDIFTGKPI